MLSILSACGAPQRPAERPVLAPYTMDAGLLELGDTSTTKLVALIKEAVGDPEKQDYETTAFLARLRLLA
jgi:hypothetical protein